MLKRIKRFLYFIQFAVFLFVMGCNDRSSIPPQSLKADVEIMFPKDDTLQLFYKMNADDRYTESLSIKKFIRADSDYQKVHFELPPGIKPKNLRFDFGELPGQDSFRLKEITLSYKKLKLIGNTDKILEWFDLNPNLSYDSANDYFHLTPDGAGAYDPQINGNSTFNKRLVKLFIPDVNDTD